MKELDKKKVDNVIRATKKCFKTRDLGYTEYMNQDRDYFFLKGGFSLLDLIKDLAKYRYCKSCTYTQIYDCLKVLGYEVVDNGKE